MKKVYILLILFFISVIAYLCFNPILIYNNTGSNLLITKKEYQKGDTINVLGNYNFDEGNWVVYLILKKQDSDSFATEIPNGKILKTESIELLKGMKESWVFKSSGGDLATVQSQIRFYKDDVLIFVSNIVLDEGFEALQSEYFGYIYPEEKNVMIKYCMQFERVFSPVVIL